MKILHLISSGGMYGAETMLLNLCKSLDKLKHKVRIAVFRNEHRAHLEIAVCLRNIGLAVTEIPCSGRLDLRAIRAVRKLIESEQADVVHSHGYKADIYACIATLFTSTRLVSTAHNWTGKSEVPQIYNKLDRVALRWFDRIVAVSGGVAEILRDSGIPSEKIAQIANGIDTEYLDGTEAGLSGAPKNGTPVSIGLVGRLVEEKGGDCFLRAAAALLPQFPRTRFMLIGEGPERSTLESLAQKLGINGHVIFTGHLNDMPTLYASLDICVLPSLKEGMPMTILEAMAAGKPVVCTAVGEIPNVVNTGMEGILIRPGSVAELSNALAQLLGDADLRERMGKMGREKVHRYFSADAMAASYVAMYNQVVRQNHARMAAQAPSERHAEH
jgi:glycosyltransferase involved in cell wall biosynthesis